MADDALHDALLARGDDPGCSGLPGPHDCPDGRIQVAGGLRQSEVTPSWRERVALTMPGMPQSQVWEKERCGAALAREARQDVTAQRHDGASSSRDDDGLQQTEPVERLVGVVADQPVGIVQCREQGADRRPKLRLELTGLTIGEGADDDLPQGAGRPHAAPIRASR